MAKLSKVQRNWLSAVIIVIALGIGGYAVQYYGLYDVIGAVTANYNRIADGMGGTCPTCGQGLTGADIIEALAPEVDVLGYSVGCAECGDVTPEIRISLLNYGTSREEMPKHIRLTDGGYVIVEEALDWKPGKVETNEQKLCWDYAKYEYYSENGMFLPGQKERVRNALEDTYQEYSDATTRRLLYAVFMAAAQETGEWNRIKVQILYAMPHRQLTESGTQITVDLYVWATLTIYKVGQRTAVVDGEEITVKWQPHMAVPVQGQLTEEDFKHLEDSDQMQVTMGYSMFFGPTEYTGPINHPWQKRELQQ